jgi:hypothetical protein
MNLTRDFYTYISVVRKSFHGNSFSYNIHRNGKQ